MKEKKIIMLILVFILSLLFSSVVKADDFEVINEYMENDNKYRWVEIKLPAEYTDVEWSGTSDFVLSKTNGKKIRFLTYGEEERGYDPSDIVIEKATDGRTIVKIRLDEVYNDDYITRLNVSVARLNTEDYETVYDYKLGSMTPDTPPPPIDNDDNDENGILGDENNPYKIRAVEGKDFEIKYKSIPFYFCIPNDAIEGTFLVDWDEDRNVVRFRYIEHKFGVGWIRDHDSSTEYIQAGAESINLTGKTAVESVPVYIIKEYDEQNRGDNLSSKRYGQRLKNAFNYIGEGVSSYEQHPASYVFVCKSLHQNRDGRFSDVIYQFCGIEEPEENAGFLETLCTKVLAFLGDLFMTLIKAFLGADVTIDKIIFNEYEPVVIDLEGGRGILGSASVRTMIQGIYNMFVAIAVVVYVTILLYVGVKVLFGIATPRQGEYRKDLTNWLVGLVLLFIVPQFFRYVPSIVNSIINYMNGNGRIVMYSYYNMDVEMDSEKIGVSGEDNRSTYIEKLKGIREEKEGELASAKSKRDWLIKNGINLNNTDYQEAIRQVKDVIGKLVGGYDVEKVMKLINQKIASTPRTIDINKLAENVLVSAKNKNSTRFPPIFPPSTGLPNIPTSIVIQKDIDDLADVLSSSGYVTMERELFEKLEKIKETYGEEKTLEEQIANLTALIDAPDLMGDMRVLAGQTGRFTYAIVWWICIYEMIVILCMYYRRVIVMGILITIYPLVAMTYPIDKLKDGKAQTLTNWYKEFTVNLVVQIVHAVVYLLLVQSGIKLYQANANNWLFFILAVLFLFPAERLMRGIFGLKGTSIKELKANAVGIAGTAATAITLGKQTGRAANEKFGITKKGKEAKANKQKAADKAKKNRDNRDKYLQGRADIKENQRKQKAAQRRRRAASMSGTRKMAYNAYAKTMNAAGRARSAAYKLGNKGRKLKGQYRKLQDSNLAKYAKGTWRVARGATGMAVGAANFVTTSGTSGLGAGFVSGTSVARMVGGFKDRDRLQKAIDNRASSQTANTSQNANAGSGGSNGGRSTPRTTPRINVPPSVGGAPSPNNGSASATTGNVQVNVTTTTNRNTNTKTDD